MAGTGLAGLEVVTWGVCTGPPKTSWPQALRPYCQLAPVGNVGL
jgi:hypothetical protein